MDSETTIAAQKETILRKDAEIKRLKRALRTLLKDSDDEGDKGAPQDGHDIDAVSSADDSDSNEEYLPEPIESLDSISYSCAECGWEVIDGVCSQCGLQHEWTSEHEEDMGWAISPYGDNLAINWDRSLTPRGYTPLLHGPFLLEDSNEDGMTATEPTSHAELPLEPHDQASYLHYLPLLARGATISMCDRYQLEYTYEDGIFAWADEDLMDEFSGPAMNPGDHWKIHLGRRITLEDSDTNGEEFMEALLEDAVLFPLRSALHPRKYEQWQTTEEEPGIWVTRPVADKEPRPKTDDAGSESDPESDKEDTRIEREAIYARDDAALEPDARPVPEGPIRPDNYLEAEYEGEPDANANIILDDDVNDADFYLRDGPDTAWDSDDSSYFDPESSPSESGDEEPPVMDTEYLEDLGRRIGALVVAQQAREAAQDEDSD